MTDNLYFLSSMKHFAAWKKGPNSYNVVSRKNDTDGVVGFIRLFEVPDNSLGRWMFDPLLTPLTATDMLDISALITDIKEAHNDFDDE